MTTHRPFTALQARTALAPPARRRRSRWVLAATVCLLALAPGVATAQTGTLDQQQTSVAGGSADIRASRDHAVSLAQTFTAGRSGTLDQVDLVLAKDSDGIVDPLTVEIRTVAAGAPGPTVLASASIPPASVPTGQPTFVGSPFTAPATVTAGTQYAIVVYVSSSGDDDSYRWGRAGGDVYPGGGNFDSQDPAPPSTWFAHPSEDMAFKTYVSAADTTAPVSTVTPAPGALASRQPLISVTATATLKTTAGATIGTVGPVRCFDTRGLNLTLAATDTGGSGVASLTYSATGAQPIPATTATTLPTTAAITTPGVTKVTYAATDNAGNIEQPANSETVLVTSGFACATPTPSRFAIPAHGSATIQGTAVIGQHTIPFSTIIRY